MRFASIALAIAGAAALTGVARAEVAEPTARLWTLQITPYVWAAALSGEVSPFQRGPTFHVNESFADILESLRMAGFVNAFGRYDRFVFSGDFMYVDTSNTKILDLHDWQPVFPPGISIGGTLDSSQLMATLEAGYRIYEDPRLTFDVLAGARFWRISNTVTVFYDGPPRDFSFSHKETFSWTDPVIGARAFYSFTDKLSTLLQVDVGGFGVGSEETWQILATLNYAFRPNMAVSAGYKYLHVNYRNDGHVFDTDLHGPVLGYTYRF